MNNSTSQSDKTDKFALVAIGLVSLTVFIFLFWLIYFKDAAASTGVWTTYLPAYNAILNSLTAILLILGIHFIKGGNRSAHIKCMLAATITSALFLVGYVLYHHFHGDTKFLAMGTIRKFYFAILISHIGLSIVQVPMIFSTLYFAFRKNYEKHKVIAKITYPVWLYVSLTGVLIYVFLKLFNVPA